MKIKVTQNFVDAVSGEVFRMGHEYVVTTARADEYVACNIAERVEAEPVEPEPTEAVEPAVKKSRKTK